MGPFSILFENNLIFVVTRDVMASNGVIHVVNKVILPPPSTTTVAPPIGKKISNNIYLSPAFKS